MFGGNNVVLVYMLREERDAESCDWRGFESW